MRALRRFNETADIKHLTQYVVYVKRSINIRYYYFIPYTLVTTGYYDVFCNILSLSQGNHCPECVFFISMHLKQIQRVVYNTIDSIAFVL